MLVGGDGFDYISNFYKFGEAVQIVQVCFTVEEVPKDYILSFFKDQRAPNSTEILTITLKVNFFRGFKFRKAYCLVQEAVKVACEGFCGGFGGIKYIQGNTRGDP